jgi:threonine synthase
MDILVSSNLERLIFELSNHDDEFVRKCMEELNASGRYEIKGSVKTALQRNFAAGCCDDEQTKKTIGETWQKYHYLIDPHTAVAIHVLNEYRKKTSDDTPTLVASTASPFKFCDAVLDALGIDEHRVGTDVLDQLSEVTGIEVPLPLAALKGAERRFLGITEKESMIDLVIEMLK